MVENASYGAEYGISFTITGTNEWTSTMKSDTKVTISRSTMQRVESKIVATSTEDLRKVLRERDPDSTAAKLINEVLKDREAASGKEEPTAQ